MTDEQLQLLLKARQSLFAAQILLDGNCPNFAASRTSDAILYIAEAFLEGEGMSFSKHSAVISAFGREFARTNRVPVEYHRFIIEAQALRNTGDYGNFNAVTFDDASEQITRGEEFLALAFVAIGTF